MKRLAGKKNLYAIITYIILFGIIPVTLFFLKNIGTRMNSYIIDTMENSAELCAKMIERQYENDMQMLDSLAVQLSGSFDDDPQLAIERMTTFAEHYGMKRVAFSFPDGTTLTTDDSELNMKGGENFERALLGERVLSTAIQDRADGSMIYVYVIPVYQKDTEEILGVLAAVYHSEIFEDIDLFRTTLEKLRSFGFRILMDDFGTGYSSLMMLNSVPIDIIKLDKSFIDDYADEKGRRIIQCVLNLARVLKLPVIAEGVETKEQYLYLKNSGCDVIQGFYFSKPIPTEEFLKKLLSK